MEVTLRDELYWPELIFNNRKLTTHRNKILSPCDGMGIYTVSAGQLSGR